MNPSRLGGRRRLPPKARRPSTRRRAGITAVIAMLYMVLFAFLAVGFYAQTTMSAQVGHNEQRMLASRTAAESGMEFMRYQLSLIQVPPLTPDAWLMDEVYKHLSNRLELTGNLGSKLVYMDAAATRIEVPEGANNYISLQSDGPRFRVIILKKGRDLVVTTVGSPGANGPTTRSGVEVTFRPVQEPGSFFSRGLSSMGAVKIDTNDGLIQGTPPEFGGVLALGTATIGPGKLTSPAGMTGELYVRQGAIPVLLPPVSVEGETNPAKILDAAYDHTSYLAPEEVPEFPVADTSIFKKFATNKYVSGKAVYDNTLVPPNTNPTFTGPCTVRGVLYVQQPNYVKFSGGVLLHCIVATEDVNVGTLATNVLEFTGSGGAKEPVSTLPLTESQFDGIRELTGSFIVAPGFDVKISGSFGTAVGDICGDRITVNGNATVNIAGCVYTLAPFPLTISTSASIAVTQDPNSKHSGLRHSEAYYSLPSTWREVTVP